MILRIHKRKWDHFRFSVLFCLLAALLLIRYGLQLGIPRIALTAVIALIAFFGDRNEILAIALCCIPMHEMVDFSYALSACAGLFVMKNYSSVRVNLSVILVLFIILWELLHCLEPNFSMMSFLFSVIPLIFLAVILCVDVSNIEYAFIVRAMATAAAVTCLVLLVNLIVRANFDIAAAIAGLQRLGTLTEKEESTAMVGSAINPNSLGIICVLSITGLLQLRAVEENRKTDIALMIILLVFGGLTSSRTYLVCLILMALLMLLGQPGDIKKKIRLLCILALLTFVALLLLSCFFPELLLYYSQRFQTDNIAGSRDVLLATYHKYITEDPKVLFWGIGRHNYSSKLTEIYRVARNIPHNAIQEIIVAWGIPGLILLALLCGMMLVQSRKYNRIHNLMNYVPLLIIMAKSMAGQFLTSTYTMLAISYAYLSLCQNFHLKEKR